MPHRKKLQNALFLSQKNQFDEAERLFQEILKVDKNSFVALLELARIQLKKQNYGQALKFLKKSHQLNTQDLEVLRLLCITTRHLELFDQSLKYFKISLEIDPNTLPVCFLLGNLYQEQGNFAGAVKMYKEILSDDPHFTPAINALTEIKKLLLQK